MHGSVERLHRRTRRIAGLAFLTLLVLGLQPLDTAAAATGDVLRQFTPTNSGNGRGMAFDGTYLYYTLADVNRIYKVTTSGTAVATIPPVAPGTDAYGGPLAWDGSDLWTMNYAADSFTLFKVSPADGHTISTCNIETQNPEDPAVTSSPNIGDYPDGLDYENGTLWVSSEAFSNNWVVQVDTSCTILREFHPAVKDSSGTSGVAFDGTNLWHAYPRTSQPSLVQTSVTGTETGTSFTVNLPIEDLAFDDTTFAPNCALWGNAAGTSNAITAYEVPCGQPDLSLTGGLSGVANPVAGTNEPFHVTVTNVGGADSEGYTFTAPLPTGTSFSDADATNTGSNCTLDTSTDPDTITCDRTAVTLGASEQDEFDFVVGINSGFTDPTDSGSLQLDGTIHPSGTDGNSSNDADSTTVTVHSKADLEISKSATTPASTPANTIFANTDATKNAVTFSITLVNHGKSNAHNVAINDTLDPTKLTNATFCQVPEDQTSCTPGDAWPGTVGGEGTSLAPGTYQWIILAHARSQLGHGAEPVGQLTNHNIVSVDSTTPPFGQATDQRTSSDVTTLIDTVPGTPTINLATAGNQKVGLNWSAPAKDGGTPITAYTVYASPCPAGGASCAVLSNISPAPNAGPIVSSQFTTFSYFVTSLQNNTPYTFTVTATNAVGEGDPSDGASATPNVSADTNSIQSTGTGSVDTGLAGGALGCGTFPADDPRCKDIVGKYSITDQKDIGALIALGAVSDPTYPGGPIPCLEFDFETGGVTPDGECVGATPTNPFGKVVVSIYPTSIATLSAPHLAYEQDDASITTAVLGSPCFKLVTNANGTPVISTNGQPICANPNYPRNFGSGPNKTNMCPEGTGWSPTHQCAYIYYAVERIEHYDMTPSDCGTNWPNCDWGTLKNPAGTRPIACDATTNCGKPVIFGSSVSAGILFGNASSTNGHYAVRPWCSGKVPDFTWAPCVFKTLWLNKTTNKGNQDIQWQTYEVADPGGKRTG